MVLLFGTKKYNVMYLDWISTGIQLVGTFLMAHKNTWAWPVLMVSNIIWIIFSLATSQYSIFALNLFYFFFNIWGWRKWKKDE